jgi:hypothetical protein
VSTRAASLLLSIASVYARLTGQQTAADVLSMAALATLTFGVQRFPMPARLLEPSTPVVRSPERSSLPVR